MLIKDTENLSEILSIASEQPYLYGSVLSLNLFSVNIHVHQKPSSAIFREGIRLGLVYRVRVSFR